MVPSLPNWPERPVIRLLRSIAFSLPRSVIVEVAQTFGPQWIERAKRTPHRHILGCRKYWLFRGVPLLGHLWNGRIHEWIGLDARMHDHAADNITIVLEGEVLETGLDGIGKVRRKGDIVVRLATDTHRVDAISDVAYTLWITRVDEYRSWGFVPGTQQEWILGPDEQFYGKEVRPVNA